MFKLSWEFAVFSLEPMNKQLIFVDAVNGEILNDIPLLLNANTPGVAGTLYSGSQSITCDSIVSAYRLYESRATTIGNSAIINTRDLHNNTSGSVEFTNINTNWISGSWIDYSICRQALDVHWGAEKIIDYFKTIHNRNSLNNLGLRVYAYARYGSSYNNAFWDSSLLDVNFGDGDGTTRLPFTALDIVAHEIGHGITQFTANLSYTAAESGALNEGFNDIWAACAKNWIAPTKPIWRLASEIFPIGSSFDCIRNMQNPKSTAASSGPNPNTYEGTNWDFTNAKMHNNSTVLSHWFYLMCQGGSGTNDKGFAYSVTGIGITKGEKIAYGALSYLNSSSNFFAARNATIQAAANLYGDISPEVVSVVNAWDAVGVLQPPRTVNLGFHYNNGPSGITAFCSGSGIGGYTLSPMSTQNYQVTNYTPYTIIQTISVGSGYHIYLDEEPRGSYVLTGEGTSSLTVTYYLYREGTTVNSLVLKFIVS